MEYLAHREVFILVQQVDEKLFFSITFKKIVKCLKLVHYFKPHVLIPVTCY